MSFLRKWKDFFVYLFFTYKKVFMADMVFGIICYGMLLQNHLTNSVDGVWEGNYYQSGKWQISLGRFATLYVDKIRFGIQTEPINSILALALFSLGLIFILEVFQVKTFITSFIFCGMFLSGLSVGVSLSYRFMSPIFASAFMLACFSVVCLSWKEHHKKWRVILSALGITSAMGLYQSSVSIFVILLITYGIHRQIKVCDYFQEGIYWLEGLGVILFGGFGYVLFVRLHQFIFHAAQSSYNGGNQYGIANSLNQFWVRFRDSYDYFFRFYEDKKYYSSYFEHYFPYLFMVMIAFISLLEILYIHEMCKRGLSISILGEGLYQLLLIALLPPACFAVSFLATDTGVSVQMVGAYCLLPGLLFLLSINQTKRKLLKLAIFVIGGTLIYGQVYQCQVDQQAMLSGRNASYQIAERIMDEIIDEDLYREEYTYCILGTAAECQLFCPEELYGKANYYAMFGCWWRDNSDKSWRGIYEELGMRLPLGGSDTNTLLESEEQYQKMPCFPQKGSIELSENYKNIVIIKLR